jgi:hypothetical protein
MEGCFCESARDLLSRIEPASSTCICGHLPVFDLLRLALIWNQAIDQRVNARSFRVATARAFLIVLSTYSA